MRHVGEGFRRHPRVAHVQPHRASADSRWAYLHLDGEILKETRRHFCEDGQIFNLRRQHTSTSTNRQRLYDALVSDGKSIRAADRDQLSLDSMFTPERVQEAINSSMHTAPGHDG